MYSLVLKKGKIELNLSCEDKEFVARQLEKIIRQASSKVALNPLPVNENVNENIDIHTDEHKEEFIDNIQEESQVSVEEAYETVVVKTPEFHHLTKEEISIANAQIAPVEHSAITINSLQNPVEESESVVDFEQILNNEMQTEETAAPITKDENFIQYVQSKSAIEKLDFLVISAQYLAKYENMNTFSLKHINSKLMQNFTLIVDHAVLQTAISKELVTKIIDNPENSEYMLTEKGLRSY